MGLLVRINKNLRGLKAGAIWWFTNSLLASMPSKHLRWFGLKIVGMNIGKNVRFYQGFHIRNPKGIIINDGVSVGPRVLLDGRCGIRIGIGATLAYDCIIWSLNHDYNDAFFCGKGAPVEIGSYAWICSRAIVLPGVKVGEGAVVASGAVVTHNVEPYTVVGGIPARVISRRNKIEYKYGYSSNNDFSHIN